MKLKLTCKSCKHEITAFQSDIKEGVYMDKGHNLKIISYSFKIPFFASNKEREVIDTYKLMEQIKSKYCICFCGSKNYLQILTSDEIFNKYETEHISKEIGEWENCSYK